MLLFHKFVKIVLGVSVFEIYKKIETVSISFGFVYAWVIRDPCEKSSLFDTACYEIVAELLCDQRVLTNIEQNSDKIDLR